MSDYLNTFDPLLIYSRDLSEFLKFNSTSFPMHTPSEEIVDRGGVFIQDNLLSLKTKETGSTGSTLEFSLPASDPKTEFIATEKFVDFRGKTYIIKQTEDIDDGLESRVSVYAERWWYVWTQKGISFEASYDGYDAPSAVNLIASSWMTDNIVWSNGVVEGEGILELDNTMGKSTLERLKDIESTWGGYLRFNLETKKIDLLSDPGRDLGVSLTYDRDIKSITRTVDTSNMVTRLLLFRKDGSIITSSSGQYYLYNYHWTNRAYDGSITFDDDYAANVAFFVARERLKQMSSPVISYDVSLSGVHHDIQILDKVSVRDKDFNRIVKTRVSELEIDYLQPQNSRMVLGNLLATLSTSAAYFPPANTSKVPMTPPENLKVVTEGYYDGELPTSRIIVTWTPRVFAATYLVDLYPGPTKKVYIASERDPARVVLERVTPGEEFYVTVCVTDSSGRMSPWVSPIKVTAVGPTT